MIGAGTLRQQLRKSLLIAPAEDALRRASTQQELEDAWFDFCDGFADESPERTQLRKVWDERVAHLKQADKWLRYARTL